MEQKIPLMIVYQQLEVELSTADNAALYSDLSIWTVPGFLYEQAESCIQVYLVMQLLSMSPLQDEDMRNFLARKAYLRNLEGQWEFLNRVTRLETSAPQQILNLICETIGSHAFFGNWIPKLKKIIKLLRRQTLYLSNKKKVIRPKRKRGYNDKGHLRDRSKSLIGKLLQEREPYVPILLPPSPFYQELYGPGRNVLAQMAVLQDNALKDEISENERLIKRKERNKIKRIKYKERLNLDPEKKKKLRKQRNQRKKIQGKNSKINPSSCYSQPGAVFVEQ